VKSLFRVTKAWLKRRQINRFLTALKVHQELSRNVLGVDLFFVSAFDTDTRNVIEEGVPELPGIKMIIDSLLESQPEVFENSIAIDAGANYGTYSIFFSRYFDKVYAYEPHPKTYAILEMNLATNSKVTCREFALSDQENTAKIYQNKVNHSGGSTLENDSNRAPIHVYEINTTRLDLETSYFQSNHKIGLIKLDVEGHEYRALLGAIKTIEKFHPPIIFELNSTKEKNQQLLELLIKIGYQNFSIPPSSFISGASKRVIFRYLISKKNPIREFLRIYDGTDLIELKSDELPKSELVLAKFSN
jgi:FkbM family methyltransferase